jgi:uncharacterized protein YukE
VSRVQVDPDQVSGAAARLGALGHEVDELTGAVAAALRQVAGAAGGPAAPAGHRSAGAWGRAVAARAETAALLAAVTGAAADAYRFTEAAARGRFDRAPVPAR